MLYTNFQTIIKNEMTPNLKQVMKIEGLVEYVKLGIPSALMICIEWWSYEFITIISGYISVEAQAAQVVMTNINALIWMIALGLQQASCCYIGH